MTCKVCSCRYLLKSAIMDDCQIAQGISNDCNNFQMAVKNFKVSVENCQTVTKLTVKMFVTQGDCYKLSMR